MKELEPSVNETLAAKADAQKNASECTNLRKQKGDLSMWNQTPSLVARHIKGRTDDIKISFNQTLRRKSCKNSFWVTLVSRDNYKSFFFSRAHPSCQCRYWEPGSGPVKIRTLVEMDVGLIVA